MSNRTFSCDRCGRTAVHTGTRGRLPSTCKACKLCLKRPPPPVRMATCAVCCRGFRFTQSHQSHCSQACARWWASADQRRATKKRLGIPKWCHWCGSRFQRSTGANHFCSTDCRTMASLTCSGRHTATMSRVDWRHCVDCGRWFTLASGNEKRCDGCRKEQGKRRNRTARHRQLVLDRDGWTCHLCGDGIPRDAIYPDPFYGTLDHVIPDSLGGSDEPENLRAAHFICNTVRGSTPIEV